MSLQIDAFVFAYPPRLILRLRQDRRALCSGMVVVRIHTTHEHGRGMREVRPRPLLWLAKVRGRSAHSPKNKA